MRHIGGLIKRLDMLNMRMLASFTNAYGLTGPQLDVLNAVYELLQAGTEPNQRVLEKHLYLTNPTVTGLLNRLEAKGMIERVRDERDARSNRIRITQRGIACRQEVHTELDESERRLTAVLNEEEKQALERILLKLIEDIDNMKEVQG